MRRRGREGGVKGWGQVWSACVRLFGTEGVGFQSYIVG